MNDSASGSNSKRPLDDIVSNDNDKPPDVAKKRSRGPNDCLNYEDDSDEEEFTPYTQSNPDVMFMESESKPKLVFAKKSSAKKSSVKSKRKGTGKSSKAKNGSKDGSSSKGKCGGNNELSFVL